MLNIEQIADDLYSSYCKSVGGVAYDRTPLLTWREISEDPMKAKQRQAWIDVAERALTLLTRN